MRAAAMLVMAVLMPAMAQAADPVGFEALQRGEYDAAQSSLAARLANGSNEPGVLLNLAHVYGRDGRRDDATMLYRQVLDGRNVVMEMADGRPAWSHALAQRGLQRLSRTASR